MVVFRLWRGVSRTDGTYSRVIEDVNRGRFMNWHTMREWKIHILMNLSLCGGRWLVKVSDL